MKSFLMKIYEYQGLSEKDYEIRAIIKSVIINDNLNDKHEKKPTYPMVQYDNVDKSEFFTGYMLPLGFNEEPEELNTMLSNALDADGVYQVKKDYIEKYVSEWSRRHLSANMYFVIDADTYPSYIVPDPSTLKFNPKLLEKEMNSFNTHFRSMAFDYFYYMLISLPTEVLKKLVNTMQGRVNHNHISYQQNHDTVSEEYTKFMQEKICDYAMEIITDHLIFPKSDSCLDLWTKPEGYCFFRMPDVDIQHTETLWYSGALTNPLPPNSYALCIAEAMGNYEMDFKNANEGDSVYVLNADELSDDFHEFMMTPGRGEPIQIIFNDVSPHLYSIVAIFDNYANPDWDDMVRELHRDPPRALPKLETALKKVKEPLYSLINFPLMVAQICEVDKKLMAGGSGPRLARAHANSAATSSTARPRDRPSGSRGSRRVMPVPRLAWRLPRMSDASISARRSPSAAAAASRSTRAAIG